MMQLAPTKTTEVVETFDLCREKPDVILFARDSSLHYRIKVSSTILKQASPVFNAMFGPHFCEGQGLDDACLGPREIDIEEDDPPTFLLLCQILHHRADSTAMDTSTYTDLFLLAEMVDKYDCIEATAFATETFLGRYYDCHNSWDVCDGTGTPTCLLIVAAFLLRSSSYFAKSTAEVALNAPGTSSTSRFTDTWISDYIPDLALGIYMIAR